MLPTDYQQLMNKQCKSPSPSPSSWFTGAAATAWSFKFWQDAEQLGVSFNCTWQTVLVAYKSILIYKPTQAVFMAIASSEWAFLAWDLVPVEEAISMYVLKKMAIHCHGSL